MLFIGISNPSFYLSAMIKWKTRIHEIIFEADTPLGKFFDVVLLVAIILSVIAVMAESVESFNAKYGSFLDAIEWVFTILFTVEYLVRIFVTRKPRTYIFSFYGIIDLLSILPTYLSLIIVGSHSLVVIRTIRLLRVFRIFKLARFIGEGRHLAMAMKASRAKITVFLGAVLSLVIIVGTAMYLIEAGKGGFASIPSSIYWAIVTLTTVGYGDIVPVTRIGQMLASVLMIMGYAIIAVPTGILTVELSKATKTNVNTQVCGECGFDKHDDDAKFCKRCGEDLLVH